MPAPSNDLRPGDAIDLGRGAWAPRSAVIFTFSRSGGPGGQNVNKVNSRADLHLDLRAIKGLSGIARARLVDMAGSHLVGAADDAPAIHFTSDEHRSQLENREACIARLRQLVIAAATIPKARKKTKPSRSSKERRLEAKRREGERKQQRRRLDD